MNSIKIDDAKGYTVHGTMDIAASFKPYADSTDQKTVTLRVRFSDVSLQSIVQKSLAPVRIAWQNNVGRKKFDTFKMGQVIEIDFVAPAKQPMVDPEVAMVERLKGLTAEQAEAKLRQMMVDAGYANDEENE